MKYIIPKINLDKPPATCGRRIPGLNASCGRAPGHHYGECAKTDEDWKAYSDWVKEWERITPPEIQQTLKAGELRALDNMYNNTINTIINSIRQQAEEDQQQEGE